MKALQTLKENLRKANGGYLDEVELRQHLIANYEANREIALASRKVWLITEDKSP